MDETNPAPSPEGVAPVAESNQATSVSLSTAVATDAPQPSLSTSLPVDQAPIDADPTEIPQETLLARLHADLEALEQKIEFGIHVFAHEVAAIREQVKNLI